MPASALADPARPGPGHLRPRSRRPVAVAIGLVLTATACAAPAADEAGAGPGATVHSRETLVPAMRAALRERTSVHVEATTTGRTPVTVTADLARDDGAPRARMTVEGLPMAPGPAELRVVDGTAYLSAAPLTRPGRFVSAPLPRHRAASPTPEALEPRRWVRRLSAALRSVRHVGAEEHAGDTWQRYEVTVAAKRLPEQLTTDVWLDEEDLLRRVRLDLPAMPGVAPSPGTEGAGTGELRVDLSAWDEPVEVTAPPAAVVDDAPAWLRGRRLMGLLSGRAGSAARP